MFVGVCVGVDVTVAVGVTPVIKQSKVAVKSNVSQLPLELGVGVGHTLSSMLESKLGQILVLGEGPKIIHSPDSVNERHHFVLPVL